MSEEEIMDIIKDFLELREIHSSDTIKSYLSIYKEAIQSLLDLYNKEKEKNKELEKYKTKHSLIKKHYISKDKIKEIIEELEQQEDWYIEHKGLDELYGRIDTLKELLEEE